MSGHSVTAGTKAGTVGGTLLNVIVSLDAGDIGRTVILASIGAMVSFCVSLFLKWLVRTTRRKRIV